MQLDFQGFEKDGYARAVLDQPNITVGKIYKIEELVVIGRDGNEALSIIGDNGENICYMLDRFEKAKKPAGQS